MTKPKQPTEMSCALCGYFCDNAHHANNWFEVNQPIVDHINATPEFFKDKKAIKLMKQMINKAFKTK